MRLQQRLSLAPKPGPEACTRGLHPKQPVSCVRGVQQPPPVPPPPAAASRTTTCAPAAAASWTPAALRAHPGGAVGFVSKWKSHWSIDGCAINPSFLVASEGAERALVAWQVSDTPIDTQTD